LNYEHLTPQRKNQVMQATDIFQQQVAFYMWDKRGRHCKYKVMFDFRMEISMIF